MTNVNLNAGCLPNFFAVDTITHVSNLMRKFPTTLGRNNPCHGVDRNHRAYPWFMKIVMAPLREYFDADMQLIFGMFLDCREPFHLHDDVKPIPDYRGRHFISFLLPVSVDHGQQQCDLVSTFVFNQTHQVPENMPDLDDNISSIYHSRLGHVDSVWCTKVNVKIEARWNVGDVIWWDSRLLHVSSNFLADGVTSKQAIVGHTYVLQ